MVNKRLKRVALVLIVVLVLVGVLIYVKSGEVDDMPNMVTYLKKYAGWDIRQISQISSKEDGYKVLDTYFDMNGKYRLHYVCKNRPGLKINDNKVGCLYRFDGGKLAGDRTFYDHFNDRNAEAVEKLILESDGIGGDRYWVEAEDDKKLEEFFWKYLELPEMADFYRVCFERKHSVDYSRWELSCNDNSLRVGSQSLFEWAVEHDIKP